MKEVDILWNGVDPVAWKEKYESFVLGVLNETGSTGWEISVTFCSDPFIRELNRSYRYKDEPTDVLSFPQDPADRPDLESGDQVILGDLVISLDTLRVNAAYFSVPEDEELKRLTIHGILHLQGWDHETNDPGEPMLVLQEEILKKFTGVEILS